MISGVKGDIDPLMELVVTLAKISQDHFKIDIDFDSRQT